MCSNYSPIPVSPTLVLRSCVMSWTFCFDQERRAPPPVPKKPAKGPAPLIRERSLESSQRQEARKRLMAARRAASVRQNSATESAESIEIYIPEAQTRLWGARARPRGGTLGPPAASSPGPLRLRARLSLSPGTPTVAVSLSILQEPPPRHPSARTSWPMLFTELRHLYWCVTCLVRIGSPFFSWQSQAHLCRDSPLKPPAILSSLKLVCPQSSAI